jgi:hypothetical protein
MPHSRFPVDPEKHFPTLWPPESDDRTPMESAIDACERENRALKDLVVSLSEIILSAVIGKK